MNQKLNFRSKIFLFAFIIIFLSSSLSVAADKFVLPSERAKTEGVVADYKNPTLSGIFSTLIPGSGHAYQGNWRKGFIFLGMESALLTSFFLNDGDSLASDIGRGLSLDLFQNLHFYNAYSSYQDARIRNGNKDYNTPVAKHSLGEMALAPFDVRHFTRWTFLLPIGALGGLIGYAYYSHRDHLKFATNRNAAWGIPLAAGTFTAVGVGEESFYRGFLQPEFTDLFGTPWLGIPTASALFGLSHFATHDWTGMGIAALIGSYLGWISHRNDYDLRESIAIHAWWDFLLIASAFIVQPKDARYVPVAITIPLP